MVSVAIFDYAAGNIFSLKTSLEKNGATVDVISSFDQTKDYAGVLLPGVGNFDPAIRSIRDYTAMQFKDFVQDKIPVLGICLGMQILLTEGNEFGRHSGLNLIEGEVIKISNNKIKEIKIPHMGWNELYPNKNEKKWKNKILGNDSLGKSFYFAHSYVCSIQKTDYIIAVSDYMGVSIPAVISKNNIYGCQFHPEKSSDVGLSFLKNFCSI